MRHWVVPTVTGALFDIDLPSGLRHQADFITADQEGLLAQALKAVEFARFEMHGVAARRRVAFFGRSYDRAGAVPPIPAFLLPLRQQIAAWAGIEAEAFAMALINEYPPGAPIGWHRDAPQYDIVAGVSLLSSCRMKFRPYLPPGSVSAGGRRTATHEVMLAPRSAYVMAGEARNAYEHHVPPVTALRYSITFRSVRTKS